ncbi:MAG TPA: uroporphyrinogen decarboxylase family protein, partial [Dehalococcoidales bacterium]|nr:uroporphyrinogen decarboxylase family protein [Dehalococcoidales bacterium]
INQMIEKMGFPAYMQGMVLTPFDAISHSMRGMRGTIMDMYRQPDNLLAACDKLLEVTLRRPLPTPNKFGNTRIFIPLTRGSDDFMSLKDFERFYWPTLKKLIWFLINRNTTPVIFFEGNFITRMEYLLDLPKGSILVHLDTTDIFKARQILKGHLCIKGNVPASILQVGSVQDVEAYCRKLIDGVGPDGGFILSPRGSTDEVKAENLMAMIEFTKKYGVYK